MSSATAPAVAPPSRKLWTGELTVARVQTGDERARWFVWLVWLAMAGTSAYFVFRGGRNVPIQEDWHVVLAALGHQTNFWGWVWEPNNEHRVPIAKLIYVVLFRIWPDFRVGMMFNVGVLAAVAGAFILAVRKMRGRTRWTDAFFPVAFLNLGHWENLGWMWELTFVVATALAAALLLVVATTRQWTTRRALVAGGCLITIPFTGATALAFVPVVAVALALEARRIRGRPRQIILASAGVAVIMSGLYFVGLPRSTWIPPSPSTWISLLTGGKLLALGLGPAAGIWWLASVLAVLAALLGAAWLLWRRRSQGSLPLLGFLLGGLLLALALGKGRAGEIPFFGLPDRYALIAVPTLCAIYLAWERFAVGRLRRAGPAVLCCAVVGLLPVNIKYGLQWRDWYHQRMDAFTADVRSGVSIGQLDHYRPIAFDPFEMWQSMLYLKADKVGVFAQLQLSPRPVLAQRIDGFDTGGGGWQTISDGASQARLTSVQGQPAMQWRYNATSVAPAVLGRVFARPVDWRGAGAIAFKLDGRGSGHRIRVRVAERTSAGTLELYDTWFFDVSSDTQTVVMPWNGFGRVDARGDFVNVLKGPMPLTNIQSVSFLITDPGPGSLVIRQVSLTPGHSQLGWPLHPAATRRSLGPWR